MSRLHRNTLITTALAATLGGGTAAWAAPITVPNSSFETHTTTTSADWTNAIEAQPAGLTGSRAGNAGVTTLTGADGSRAQNQYSIGWGWVNPADHSAGTLANTGSQITTYSAASLGTFAPNTTYTLTTGATLDGPSNQQFVGLGLWDAALTTHAATNSDNSAFYTIPYADRNIMSDFSMTVDTSAHPELVGQDMYISLMYYTTYGGGARNAYFDNVRLDATPNAVPEPASLGLLGLGALSLLRRRTKA